MSFWGGFEKRARLVAKDGIKARSSSFGKAWWSRQWIAALEAFGWSNRLSRGRSYARSGQVLDYAVAAGRVKASVQGSRPKPYEVTIALKPLSDHTWDAVLAAMGKRAEFAARLLNGDMPHDIGDAFASVNAALLPANVKELQTDCSCPDWANPCKHVAAVHYILAEALDADPFILMALRGRDREAVLGALRGPSEAPAEKAAEDVPLTVTDFWKGRGDPRALDMGLSPPHVHASVLRRLGPPGAWTTTDEIVSVLGPMLRSASEDALRTAAALSRS